MGLIWGVLDLTSLFHRLDYVPEMFPDDDWTFGQVVALLLLFAPMIALIEGYLTGK